MRWYKTVTKVWYVHVSAFLFFHLTGSHDKAVSNIGDEAINMNSEIATQNQKKRKNERIK